VEMGSAQTWRRRVEADRPYQASLGPADPRPWPGGWVGEIVRAHPALVRRDGAAVLGCKVWRKCVR